MQEIFGGGWWCDFKDVCGKLTKKDGVPYGGGKVAEWIDENVISDPFENPGKAWDEFVRFQYEVSGLNGLFGR